MDWMSGLRLLAEQDFFHHILAGSAVHPSSYPVGTGVLFLRVKWLGHESDHSSPFKAKVK
jgi:hypothetical protein